MFLAISPPAFADDSRSLFGLTLSETDKKNSSFEGAYIGLGLNIEVNNNKESKYHAELPIAGVPAIDGSSRNNVYFGLAGSLHGGYNFEINPKILLGVGVELSASDSHNNVTTDLYFTGTASSPPVLLGTTENESHLWGRVNVFISPGYVISKDKLVYTKLGISHMGMFLFNGEPPSITNTYTGYLVGLGYKQVYKENLYRFGEINYYNYPLEGETFTLDAANFSTIETSYDSLIIIVGFGYLF